MAASLGAPTQSFRELTYTVRPPPRRHRSAIRDRGARRRRPTHRAGGLSTFRYESAARSWCQSGQVIEAYDGKAADTGRGGIAHGSDSTPKQQFAATERSPDQA